METNKNMEIIIQWLLVGIIFSKKYYLVYIPNLNIFDQINNTSRLTHKN